MTNREVYEKAAGYGLEEIFFIINGINPNAEYRGIKYRSKVKQDVGKKTRRQTKE